MYQLVYRQLVTAVATNDNRRFGPVALGIVNGTHHSENKRDGGGKWTSMTW